MDQRLKRAAPSSPGTIRTFARQSSPGRTVPQGPQEMLEDRLGSLACVPFDAGASTDSPSLAPVKRARAPAPAPLALPPPATLAALADMPRGGDGGVDGVDLVESGGSSSSSWAPSKALLCAASTIPGRELANQIRIQPPPLEPSAQTNSTDLACPSPCSDWRMVLYHDKNIILHNPQEQPQFRSKRLSMEDASSSDLAKKTFGRCPLCRQTIDARFAFAAQAYFDLLQKSFKSSPSFSTFLEATDQDLDLLVEADLYRILGVARNAKADDIKRAYRKRSLRYHPDKNPDDPDAKLKFQKIAEAFSVLSDDSKRARYDNSGDMDLEGFDVEQFMNNVEKFINTVEQIKRHQRADSAGELDMEEWDADGVGEVMDTVGDNNPFLLTATPEMNMQLPDQPAPIDERVPFEACVASHGGADEEAAAAAALRHLPPGLLNTGYYARFFVETKQLGAGSFGSVHLCRHVLDDLSLGDYAVKKVPVGDNKAWLRDMVREVKTFERLHHPNVVEYKHSWLELSRRSVFCPFVPFLFILMEYANGGSLGEYLWHDGDPQTPKPLLPKVHIWQLLLDMLMGLQHLHSKGILHRDLKPFNVILNLPEGQQKNAYGKACPKALLTDFGTATNAGEVGEAAPGATSRGYTGTVEYTAPELLCAETTRDDYNEKTDMWSLGVVLYAMCFSSLPFSHNDPHVIKEQVRHFVDEKRATGTMEDGGAWLPPDADGRVGPLRLVVAALLNIDADRRPATTDLLENPAFNRQARSWADHMETGDQAALPAA